MLKILVPVDRSENSNRAVAFLIASVSLYKEPLDIHLLNVQFPVASQNVKHYIGHGELNLYYHDEGVAALKPARDLLDQAGVAYAFHIGVGEPAEIIVGYVKEKECQQIAMGTRGLGTVSAMLLGSVTTKVIQLSPVPVLLVK